MDDLFHKILQHLYNINALHQDTDITLFLKRTLGQDYNNPSLLQSARNTLGQLSNSGYISKDHQPILGQSGNGSNTNNLDDHNIKVRLELLGHNYIAEKIRQQNQDNLQKKQNIIAEKTGESVINTNKFTISNTKYTNKLFWLTLIVAGVSAFATIKSCQINNEENNRQKKTQYQDTTIQSLQYKVKQTENALFLQRNLIDSLKSVLSDSNFKLKDN